MKKLLWILILSVSFLACGQLSHDIKYEVIGDGFNADITFTGDLEKNQTSVFNRELPWSVERELDNDTDDSFNLDIILCAKKLSDDVSDFTLNIYVDNVLKESFSTDERNADVCISQKVHFDCWDD